MDCSYRRFSRDKFARVKMQFLIPFSMVADMAPGIAGKWASNTSNLPAAYLRALESHLLRGFPTIVDNPASTLLLSGGCPPPQKTTTIGTDFSVNSLDRDGSEWARQVSISWRVFGSRSDQKHLLLSTVTI